MEKKKVLDYYGNARKVSQLAGLTRQAVYQWPDPIPMKWALRLERMTNGELKFDKEMYR